MDYLITLSSPVLINGYVSDIIHRRPNAIKELLLKSIEKKNSSVLSAVLENTDIEHIRSLNVSLLFLAIKNNFPEAVDILLKCSIATANDVDPSGRSALTVAINNNSSECAARLLDAGANPNKGGTGPPPLIAAAKSNDTATIRKLIQMHADVNVTDEMGRTPLFYAAKYAIGVSVLLEAGASTDVAESSSGSTPLMVACVEGYDRVVDLMTTKCLNPNVADHFGHTALTYSAIQGHVSSVKALLSIGADPTICDLQGFSIAALAVRHKQMASLITLLQETPVLPTSPNEAVSPLSIAVRNGDFVFAVGLVFAGVDRLYLQRSLLDFFAASDDNLELNLPWSKLLQYAQNSPLSLQMLCRNVIRKCFRQNILKQIYDLELPLCILDFVALRKLDQLLVPDLPSESILQFI